MIEKEISRLIIEEYFYFLRNNLEVDVIICGAGPAGLTCAYTLAQRGLKVCVFEKRLSIGGGIWGGGMMFNKTVLSKESIGILEEIGVKYKEKDSYLIVDAIELACGLGLKCKKEGVNILNLIEVEDLVIKNKEVCGVVVNWHSALASGLHVDPLSFLCKALVDATGHDAQLVKLYEKKMGEKIIKGEGPMNAEEGEKFVVEKAGEVVPGLYVAGMAVNAVYGGPRMGPIFAGMLLSGKKTAKDILEKFKK